MLVLFDIDGTLLTTSRVGIQAMLRAGQEIFDEAFTVDGVEFAGRLDPLIIDDLLATRDKRGCAEHHALYREKYGAHLAPMLSEPGVTNALPGIIEMLDEIERTENATLGLVTGNFPETGRTKITAAGIDADRFTINAWGSDSPNTPPHRNDLPGVAIQRFLEATGAPIEGEHVVIIGDTPHDVACARAHNCRCIATATGIFSREDLESCGADLAVDDLSDVGMLMDWIFSGAPAGQ